jgi:hypothetical protein
VRLLPVTLAAALAISCASSQPPPATPSTPLEGVAPNGAVTWPFEFRWKGAGPKTVVRIQVVDEAERPLAGLEGRGDHLAAPDSLKSMLRPGLRYQWRVTRVDDNGEEVGASALTAFTVEQN